ncbi:MAG: SDR family NAD(P)-dependent oxidoreductase [Porticoccaceae bacterium]|nr:SDR family NAD(P)-dependent oxidoreductase [Porticoccaceae bacterium]
MNVLVIGITSGVAVPLVKNLLASGHKVIGTVRSDAQIDGAKRDYPGIADVFKLDMADGDSVKIAIETGLGDHQQDLDAVIVCTGIAGYNPLETAPLELFRRTLEVNTVSCLAVYQTCLPILRKTGGRIIFLSSYGGKVSMPFIGCYQASKFALESLGDVMRQEARLSGVEVVMILPGGIDTAMCHNMLADIDKEIGQLSDDINERYGHYYRGHRNLLAGPGKVSGEEVAQVTQEALEAETPETRYIVGEGAAFLIAERARLSDREMDTVFEQMFAQASQQ